MSASASLEAVEFNAFVDVATKVGMPFQNYLKKWEGSPFEWMLVLPSRTKGKVGELLVEEWLEANGFLVERALHTGCDRRVDGSNMEIKLSTKWKDGVYKFQQIRDQDYSSIFCLGISPAKVHAWLIPKDIAVKNSEYQHGGKKGKDTKWISFMADEPPQWIKPFGGSLRDVLTLLTATKK